MTETVPRPEPGFADEDFDPDDYIRTAVTYGRLDLVEDWVPHHQDHPDRVSELVLFPAAMFGQLELLGFGIDYGNVNYREEHQLRYKGWNLMHFAVHGIHMNVPNEKENKHENQSGAQQSVLLDMPEVHGRLLDILALLLSKGVDPTAQDSDGSTPSDKASVVCAREECFLDGALLIDIHVCTHTMEAGGVAQPPRTPGLETLKKLPNDMQWELALRPLLGWAYSRMQYDVLVFCHKHKFVDLTDTSLSLSSSPWPLMIDTIHTERYSLLRHIIQSSTDESVFIQKVLTKVYKFNIKTFGQMQESVLSYACRAYTDGNHKIIPSLLSPETLGRHLTHIKIENIGLDSLPLPIFSSKLTHLELGKNQLTTLPIEEALRQDLCENLQELNLSNNSFSEIPKRTFHLPRLTKLDARNNSISRVPEEMWSTPCLEELYLSSNALSCLPCPDYVYLSHGVQVSSIQTRMLSFPHSFTGCDTRHVQSCRQSYMTATTPESDAITGRFRLKILDLSCNQLTEIPPGLPCLAPQLKSLKLSSNKIVHLGHPCNYPQLLEKLDVSKNICTSSIQWCAEPPNLVCAQSQLRREHSSCSHIGHKTLSNLKLLFLEDNLLTCVMLEECQREDSTERSAGSVVSAGGVLVRGDHESSGGEEEGRGNASVALPTLMFPNLESLRLSNNQLDSVPSGMHRHVEMRELKLDGNAGITHLPSNLHHLQELFFFSFEGISDPVVTELRSCSNTPDQLLYLKAREKHYCRNTLMRLFVIGHFSKGKSTVVAALRKMRQSSTFDDRAKRLVDPDYQLTEDDRQSTVGIQCDKWLYKKTTAVKDATDITFYTWDFAGQEEYYLTHQCFFTNRALYLLVWNVTDGKDGITSLTVWLQNLQAKAPDSSVIVVGTHLDLVSRYEREDKIRVWIEMINAYKKYRVHSHLYPNILGVCFVGIPKSGKHIGVHGPNGLADCIYNVAMKMEVPNGPHLGGNTVKMMQEMIPMTYETLRRRIDSLQEEARRNRESPILPKDKFWARVKGIEGLDKSGVEAAVDFLHASTGMILHFQLPHLVDYYIIDPQCWFDLCALVISPSNVSKLIRKAGIIARGNGQLVAAMMDQALEHQGLGLANCKTIGTLIRQFLMEHGVLHKIDAENYLVPSAISPDPNLPLDLKLGYFPFQTALDSPQEEDDEYEQLSPYSTASPKLSLVSTGLVYRRTLHLPPIASGFWSKLISLCIQHEEILLLISGGSSDHDTRVGTNRLRGMVANISIEWQYWKTGIMLIADDKLLMRVNSLRRDVFEDPKHQFVISSTLSKVENFQYSEAGQWTDIPTQLSEVIEIIVPVTYLSDSGEKSFGREMSASQNSVSAKLMAKVLELVDEILKNHCEHLAMNGIYTVNDMLHLVPCPLCYGDEDTRQPQSPAVEPQTTPVNRERHTMKNPARCEANLQRERGFSKSMATLEAAETCRKKVYTFRVDECIQQTLMSDCMSCPQHGKLEIANLAPDIAFVDLALMKLDRKRFNKRIDVNEPSNLRGSFAKVVKRTFNTHTSEGSIEVAVKIFVQCDSVQPNSPTELAKNYADMRYELNKLSTMKHPLIVRFVGVLTNPLCFVLEWAPGNSLEHIRKAHASSSSSICPTSLFLVLLQVADALTYLHDAVKIIHNDLRCSNILVFQFPPTDHHCLEGGVSSGCAACLSRSESCGVLVKVADMGICANPATQKTKNKQGIRRFVPECLNYDATLTNKVDIFYLGTCLYELMSLRPLPPENREAEYRNMLKMGKREGFYTKDTAYPSFLYQVLEECWQQEQFRRPSAAILHTALVGLTGLSVRGGSTPTHTSHSLLLDSYVPYRSSRLSVIHSVVERDEGEGGLRYTACAALSSLADNCTSIVALNLSQQQPTQDSMMETKSLWSAGNISVCAVHMTTDGVVLAALGDGRIMIFNTALKTRSFIEPDKNCSSCNRTLSEIAAIHSLSSLGLLAIGFTCGQIQVCSYQETIQDSLDVHCCIHLAAGLSLHSLLCISSPSTGASSSDRSDLSVWCGTSSSSVVICELSLTAGQPWGAREHSQNVTSVSVCEEHASTAVFTAKELKLSTDMGTVVALLHQPRSQVSSLALIDTATKTLLLYVTCDKMSVSSLTLTPSKLVLGTYEGLIYLFDWHTLRQTSSPVLHTKSSEKLTAHYKCVYSVTCVCGEVTPEGITTMCPTYVGRCASRIQKEFLISVGYGRHSVIAANRATSSLFRSFTLHAGVCLCIWMI